ncbi:metallophosphoesterase [Streptomyces collinus]|uniref:metallophosphoesterase n=1 Tax=Streptomyces collinus TaxID=42684 RepID=UPI003668152A
MVIVFVLVASLVLAVVVTANWYVWRRLFRDTTRGPGLTRRAGAVLIAGGWILAITALVAERSGAPFWLQQVLAWPGFLWLALSIYLLLAVLAGEFVRPLLRRFLEHRARRTDQGAQPGPATSTASSPAGSTGMPATAPDPAPASQPGGGGGAASTATAVPASGTRAGGGGATASAAPAAASQHDGGADAPATAAPQANRSGTAPASEAGDAGRASASGTAAGSRAGGGATQASAPGQPAPGQPAPGQPVHAAASQPDRGAAATVLPPPSGPVPDASPEASPEQAAPAAPAGPSRRLFVSRVVAGAAAAAAVGTVGYGTYGVLRGPKVKRVTVPLAKLPRAAHGYRIAVVSDVHLGPVLGRGFAQKVVDTINSTQPDLIAVVGDLVDGSVKDLGPAAAPLAQLRARHGSYFVTGNHEYFSGAEQWVEEVRRLGIDPLENARREMPYFDLAGVNDVAGEEEGQGPDFAKALGDRDTARACVLLAHQPVQIHDAVEHGVDLQLSGHTHGGQLWPGNLIASGANPTLAGLDRYGDTQLYVSRGAGAWGPPTRVGAPSDITLIELASRRA